MSVELEAWYVSKYTKGGWPSGKHKTQMEENVPFKKTNQLAILWFNEYCGTGNNPWLKKITKAEAYSILGLEGQASLAERAKFLKDRETAEETINALQRKVRMLEETNATKESLNTDLSKELSEKDALEEELQKKEAEIQAMKQQSDAEKAQLQKTVKKLTKKINNVNTE